MKFKYKLGVIGYGNMASAIVCGAVEKNVLQKRQILIYDKEFGKINTAGFAYAESNSEIVKNCEYVLLSVKPQVSSDIFSEIKEEICGNTFISIMAGVTTNKIQTALGGANVIRCMPNMPCMYGLGAAGIAAEGVNEAQRKFALSLFAATGEACEVPEQMLHAVTCVSGSGPAYVYYFVKAIIDSGIKHGLTPETSKKLAVATVEGAARVLRRSEDGIDTLIDKVCSKGGTTIEAVTCFNEKGLNDIVHEAMTRCYERSVALSK